MLDTLTLPYVQLAPVASGIKAPIFRARDTESLLTGTKGGYTPTHTYNGGDTHPLLTFAAKDGRLALCFLSRGNISNVCVAPGPRGGGGGQLQPVLMRHSPQLSAKTSWGGSGGRVGGGIGSSLGGGGAARDPLHYYHMHTSRGCVCVCLGAWGYV